MRKRKNEEVKFTDEDGMRELKKGFTKAEELLKNREKMDQVLVRVSRKIKKIPLVGGPLSEAPVMIAMVTQYLSGEYRQVPKGSIIAIVSALIYFLTLGDVIPDVIPVVGYLDDAVVFAACLLLVRKDIVAYKVWRKANKQRKETDDDEKNISDEALQ